MDEEKRKDGTYCIQCLEDKKVIRETKEECIVSGWGSCVTFKRHRFIPYTKEEMEREIIWIDSFLKPTL